MSEAFADLPQYSGYKRHEAGALVGFINRWFEEVVDTIPTHKFTEMPAGATEHLMQAPGIGYISLHYHGSRPTAKEAYEHDETVPLQTCEYSVLITKDQVDRFPTESPPLGWWMPLHMVHGPKLVIDTPAVTEDLLGSTREERDSLEKLLQRVHSTCLAETV